MAQHYKKPSITESRINVFLGWEAFNPKGNVPPGRMDQNLCGRIWHDHNRSAVCLSVASTGQPLIRPSRKVLESHSFRPASVGDSFGPSFSSHLFRLDIHVPKEMHGLPVHLLWDSNSEAMVLSEDGVPLQGLVGGDSWCRRADFPLFPGRLNGVAKEGETVRLYIEIACNGLFGAGRGGDIEPPDMEKYYTLEECCIAVFDNTAWDLIHDLTLLSGLAKHLPEGPRRANALNVANQVVNAVDVTDRNTFELGRKIASKFLSKRNGEAQSVVHSMLHSHIDLAWLWPMASTPAKGARTFSTQLRLLDQYPESIFVQSQAQLYEWVKEKYPSLWTQMCEKVKEGKFVPVGATWVEMDCNIPNGESLVRQFLLGQEFFKENFGFHCKEFWLPDTFGYAAQLPQIMKGCGVDYFMTQKLSWNLFNKFPHSSFVWEGLNGTRVLSHMPPADTYNAQAFPDEVIRSVNKNKDSGVISDAIMLVGHGDGGGGASPAMVESMRRMNDLDGVPRVKFSTPFEFFRQLEEMQDDLPRWVGELYFELHRGTYTSQARTKLENRQSEILLQEAEALGSLALAVAGFARQKFTYPAVDLKHCWKLVLKNCFHDTLPGSCIAEVYRETARDYEEVRLKGIAAVKKILKYLEDCSISLSTPKSFPNGDRTLTISSECSAPVSGMLVCNERMATDENCRPRVIETCLRSDVDLSMLRWQACNAKKQASLLEKTDKPDGSRVLLALSTPPRGFGITVRPCFLSLSSEDFRPARIVTEERSGLPNIFVLENEFVRAEICQTGVLQSLKLASGDKTTPYEGREALATMGGNFDSLSQGGNKFVLYDDVSQFWCAWDSEVYSFEKKQLIGDAVSCEVVESGPLRVALHLKYPTTRAGSEIEQLILLRAGSARLDFRTSVDWRESRKILRVLFNAGVRNSHASYDSQFGYVKRPTTFNHSWEIAKFEVVGHQFCDLSEPGFGVALLSDCKYGYSVRDSTMRLSLLRASKSPDDTADIGQHFMTYALLPHREAFPCREVFAEAWDLNVPPEFHECARFNQASHTTSLAFQMITESANAIQSVFISAVKKSEHHPDAVVVRMFEAMGSRGSAVLRFPYPARDVKICNMLEEVVQHEQQWTVNREDFNHCVRQIALYFKPFEIISVLIFLKNERTVNGVIHKN
ncbi:unnamed protein product [Agarophyton chilense]|eukprot:gb/GEZJ01001659.1/.p1 GENE.gb/GEZJ01001659.1/~~gb/GEZJ01001659.1/.p1  ORF type:complete len:1160 (-),score=133.16 gb/GEZJ01001659.1/:458-3937(-)